jgi:outer membrane scaffolding protein for murein synthesis (MipA/OmpV family)
MLFFQRISLAVVALSLANVIPAGAQESGGGGFLDWIHGDWYLKVGAAGFVAPRFEGDDSYVFNAAPLISLGKAGPEARFSSRNDNVSLALIDNGGFRAGVAGKLLFERDEDASDDVEGLDPVRFGGELGGFAEVYPTDWLRLRGEVRQGIRSHSGIVGDVAVDAFTDVTPTVRVSGGPRLSVASQEWGYAARIRGFGPIALCAGKRHAGSGGGRRRHMGDDRPLDHQCIRRICAFARASRRFQPGQGARIAQPVSLRRLRNLPF